MWLNIELDLAQPKVILCLGQTAIEAFLPERKLEKGKKVADYVGQRLPNEQQTIIGCYHPAARQAAQRNQVPKVLLDVARLVGVEPPIKPEVDYRLLQF